MIFDTVKRMGLQVLTGHGDLSSTRQREIEIHLAKQRNAQTFEEWHEASKVLDSLLGNDEWKLQKESGMYRYKVVESRLEQLRDARQSGDTERLMHLLRTTLQRNLGNMGDSKLYSNCFTGTKQLVEEYITECELSLTTLMNSSQVDDIVLLNTLLQTRKAFGRTALALSGGSVFGIMHIGVIKELHAQNLLPRIVSGSSSGAIFASVLCVHLDEEFDQMLNLPILQRDFEIFEKSGGDETTMERLARFLKHGTWFDNTHLSNTMRELLGDMTFQEAYYRTRKVLNVTVSSESIHEHTKLLNYLTAPNVMIWSAVCASCSLPGVFASCDIRAKDPKTGEHYSWSPSQFIDGSVANDLPLARMAELFNVNHFIACQVNPHIVPFLNFNQTVLALDKAELHHTGRRWQDILNSAQTLLRNEIQHYLTVVGECGIFKTATANARSILAQQYSGDITICPAQSISEMGNLFKNPSKEFFWQAQLRAAQATWPKMSIIRNHCAIELALEQAIHDLKARTFVQAPSSKSVPMAMSLSHDVSTITKPPSPSRRSVQHYPSSPYKHHHRRRSDDPALRFLLRRSSSQELGKHPTRDIANLNMRASVPSTRRSSISKSIVS